MIKAKNSIPQFTKCCKAILAVLLVFQAFGLRSANDPVLLTRSYVSWYAEEAVNQMIEYKIPASVILAQAIFESRCGSSDLAKKSNNHFGIKCHIEWGGDTVTKTDDTLNECFRKYRSVEDSYTDHSLFLKSRSRYSHLFELKVTDYKGWCYGLKAAGYATFPTYAEQLIKIIEENRLYLLDGYESIERNQTVIKKEIVKSSLLANYFSVKDLAKSNALFVDEENTLIRSLELITEPPVDVSDVIAGQDKL